MRIDKVGRNDPCPCGSAKKYKRCHGFLSDPYVAIDLNTATVQERWLLLATEIEELLGLRHPYGGHDVRHAFEAKHVAGINNAYEHLIGQFTKELVVPSQSKTALGALYLGDIQEKKLRAQVLRMSLYADVIYVVDPFIPPNVIFGDTGESPHRSPEQFIVTTYQAAYFVLRMKQWIASGIVAMLPNPIFTFNDYRNYVLVAARKHAAKFKDEKEAKEELKQHMFEVAMSAELFAGLADDRIEDAISSMYNVSDESDIALFADLVRHQRRHRFDLPNERIFENVSSQFSLRRGGMDPISAAMICSQINAFPFSEFQSKLRLINTLFEKTNTVVEEWAPIAQAFQQLELEFLNEVSSDFAIGLRSDGRLQSFRSMLRQLWKKIEAGPGASPQAVLTFADELRAQYEAAKSEWEAIKVDAVKVGLQSASVFAAGAFVLNLPTLLGAGGALVGAYDHWKKSKAFKAKNPASVMIDLGSRRNRA